MSESTPQYPPLPPDEVTMKFFALVLSPLDLWALSVCKNKQTARSNQTILKLDADRQEPRCATQPCGATIRRQVKPATLDIKGASKLLERILMSLL